MKKANGANVGNGQNQKVVQTVYPLPTEKINPSSTIQAHPIDGKTALYRNRQGVIVWGESS